MKKQKEANFTGLWIMMPSPAGNIPGNESKFKKLLLVNLCAEMLASGKAKNALKINNSIASAKNTDSTLIT